MNDAQTVFTLFFAISWGIVSNVLPRWKPFHYALFWYDGFWQPTYRLLLAFGLFNIIPWLYCIFGLFVLRGDSLLPSEWTFCVALMLMLRAIVPGMMVPFGCYRLWLTFVHWWPNAFYAKDQSGVPELFRSSCGSCSAPIEPDFKSLALHTPGATKNLIAGLLWIASGFLVFVPGPK
jgi:hypothetical protein